MNLLSCQPQDFVRFSWTCTARTERIEVQEVTPLELGSGTTKRANLVFVISLFWAISSRCKFADVRYAQFLWAVELGESSALSAGSCPFSEGQNMIQSVANAFFAEDSHAQISFIEEAQGGNTAASRVVPFSENLAIPTMGINGFCRCSGSFSNSRTIEFCFPSFATISSSSARTGKFSIITASSHCGKLERAPNPLSRDMISGVAMFLGRLMVVFNKLADSVAMALHSL
nr:hypothetical protein Iba_chr04aCG6840 [Ipomoea batatas]